MPSTIERHGRPCTDAGVSGAENRVRRSRVRNLTSFPARGKIIRPEGKRQQTFQSHRTVRVIHEQIAASVLVEQLPAPAAGHQDRPA